MNKETLNSKKKPSSNHQRQTTDNKYDKCPFKIYKETYKIQH